MKSVMISIRPEWCEKILKGQKTIEVRKNAPKLATPFRCYIYCTDGRTLRIGNDGQLLLSSKNRHKNIHRCPVLNKTVLGEFTCNRILPIEVQDNGSVRYWNQFHLENSCVPYGDVANYIGNGKTGYGWCISDLKIYEQPIELSRFENDSSVLAFRGDTVLGWTGMQRPPQSWCYVDGTDNVCNAICAKFKI